jgi:hypothetical protein
MIGAASLVTSMAQVYSVNIVGYVNTAVPAGFSMIQNPLNASPDNKLANVLPIPAQPCVIYLYQASSGGYLINEFDGEAWADDQMVINPGDGFFMYNPGAAFTITFVGEVPTGSLSTPLVTGFNMVGSKVPQSGKLQTDLGYVPAAPAEAVYQFRNATGGYDIYGWDTGVWDPDEPVLGVGEAVFIYRLGAPGNWTRTFNVN